MLYETTAEKLGNQIAELIEKSVESTTAFDQEYFVAVCPMCEKPFVLTREQLRLGACESGGIYMLDIKCPFCKHEADMLDRS